MIQLSDHFSYKKLILYTVPSIVMLIVTSIYGVVDGFFVSNIVGKVSFAAVNFIWPMLMALSSVGFLFGGGGSALIAKTAGEGKAQKADEIFTMVLTVSFLCGVVLTVIGIIFMRTIAVILGAEGPLLEESILYGRIYLLGLCPCILQYEFQYLFSTAGKPKLGLWVTVAAGIANIVLDALFMAVFHWGIAGAAVASALSQCLGGFLPLIYFRRQETDSLLHLTHFTMDWKALRRVLSNGASELLSNVSMSLVGMLYNFQLLRYVGENGVAAYGVLMYVSMIFLAVFIGFSVGVAPIVSYHFGAGNMRELQSLLRKSLIIIAVSSVFMFFAGELLSKPLSILFVGYDQALLNVTLRGFFIYSFSFLFAGMAIYSSSFFTALNDGFVSAVISFLRTLVFEVCSILILPFFLKVDGIWLSIVGAECMAMVVSIVFLILKNKKYQYWE